MTYKVGEPTYHLDKYYNLDFSKERFIFSESIDHYNEQNVMKDLRDNFIKIVGKQLLSDRPLGCLLSGGLDSSLVTGIIKKYFRPNQDLHTFSIGFAGSVDLKYAKMVADFLGTIHHEVVVTVEQMVEVIEEVVKQIETYDITTVRSSVPLYLLTKWIRKNTDVVVIFSGEGADEASGSYMYFHNAPS